MDIEQFIRDTIRMPGLRDVFTGAKREDFIYITSHLIQYWRVENFHFAVERLSTIVMSLNIRVWLNAPIVKGESYSLCVLNLNVK